MKRESRLLYIDRYSQHAIDRLREALKTADMVRVWSGYQSGLRQRATA